MELGHVLWPSDPLIRESSDPETSWSGDPVELQMSTYVADKRLQWARNLPSFYRCWAFARFWKVKFWRSCINISMTVGRIFTKIYIFISLSWAFLETIFGKTRVSHRVKMMSRWPNDPVPCLEYTSCAANEPLRIARSATLCRISNPAKKPVDSTADTRAYRETGQVRLQLSRSYRHLTVVWTAAIGNESAPIQLAQCWFPGLAMSSARI